jgi:hypothetical protein
MQKQHSERSLAFFEQRRAEPGRRRAKKEQELKQIRLQATCETWNDEVPVGTAVEYEEVLGVTGKIQTKTRSTACVLGGHSAMVMIEAKAGLVAINHITGWEKYGQ